MYVNCVTYMNPLIHAALNVLEPTRREFWCITTSRPLRPGNMKSAVAAAHA